MNALEQIAERLRRESGMVVGGPRISSLAGAVARLDAGAPAQVLRALDDPVSGRDLLAHLIDEVAVKETFFLRNADELKGLDWRALHAAARARGEERVRVWCTACATGEEAYSLAILALEAFWPVTPPVDVLATDVAPTALERARIGRYRERAVAPLSPSLRERWFEPDGRTLRIRDTVKELVRVHHHNLVRDPFPPLAERPFDVITCRNVLIYFDAQDVARTVEALERALAPGGRLVLGAADRLSGGARVPPGGRSAAHAAAGASVAPRARVTRRVRSSARPARAPVAASGAPDPELDAEVALVLGRAARARGDHGDAVSWLRRTLYLDPECAVAGLELALAHAALGDAGAERRALWTALRTALADDGPKDDDLIAECRSRLAALDTAEGGGT